MTITINDQPLEIAEAITLQSVIALRLGDRQNGIAVAVNNMVIARSQREHYILQPNDSILIIKATQGG